MKLPPLVELLLVVFLLAATPGRAQPTPDEHATAEPSLQSDFGEGAEEVTARLRELTRSLADGDLFEALEAEVGGYSHRAAQHWHETSRLLARNLRTTALDSLTTYWVALHADLEDVDGRIATRVQRRESDLASLKALYDSWTHALRVASDAEAPAPVTNRIRSTLDAIERTRPELEQRRARLLVLQNAVTRAFQHCDDAIDRIVEARNEAIGRALTPQEPPVWQWGPGSSAPEMVAASASSKVDNLRMYVTTYRGRLVASLLVVLALIVLLRRAGATAPVEGAPSGLHVNGPVIRTPVAAAILSGLLLTLPLRPNPPYEFQQAMLVLMTAASVCVFRPILDARLGTALSLALLLLVASVAGQLLEPGPRLEQIWLIVLMASFSGLLLWAAQYLESARKRDADESLLRFMMRVMTYVLAPACGASALAAAAGYLDLADFLGIGLLLALMLAVGMLAVRLALDDLVAMVLTQGPLARLRTVARHRVVIARRTRTALDLLIVGLWTWIVLGRFQLQQPVRDAIDGALGASLRAGGLDLPVAHVLAFLGVLVLMFFFTRFLGIVLEEDVYSRMTLPRGVPYALSTLTRYVLLLGGFLLALGVLGLDLTRITVLVSALGLGLGFGLQQIINNFVSGLILLFERPVQVGDSIQVGDLNGEVRRIGIRSSTVHTPQGAEVIVPNSKMIEEKVFNWTLTDRRRRFDLEIGVEGNVDVESVLAAIEEIARRDPRVCERPPPEALLVRLGCKETYFQLRYWTDDPHSMRVWSDLSVSLHRVLYARRAAVPLEASSRAGLA